MQLLGSLGIDLQLLIAQIINFGVLLWVLTRFLYRPIIKRIETDETEFASLQKEKEALALADAQKQKEVREAKTRARDIITEAEGIAEDIKKRAHDETERERRAVIMQIKSRLAEISNEKKPNRT